jgi:NADH-quinone oxidoreductase subunit G
MGNTAEAAPQEDLVTIVIDGRTVSVPKGMNLIEAAKLAGIEIPFYCYHPHLSIAGNCRMCQVAIKGQPKLNIACNTGAQEGMEVSTHLSSKEVEDAQAATLEFILINHPLDCTVCDQAGHCKLQDYHYDYNARPSRFLENKEHKVKAQPLGPTVMLDGERCIMCTRCIRFCDEVTGTSELGMLNRGDRAVIAVNPDRVLDNPLSGTVVDLCPVGALTHSEWRFNTRIWFTKQTDGICPGCSTGCNAKVAVRDHEIVQVKARRNDAVNKEWMCDEGRYGFPRFLPESRVLVPSVRGKPTSLSDALKVASQIQNIPDTLVIMGCDLLLEDYFAIKRFFDQVNRGYSAAISYRERPLTPVEAILISPDYAANFRGAEFSGIVTGDLQGNYNTTLNKLRAGTFRQIVLVGDRAILPVEQDEMLLKAVQSAPLSIGIFTDAAAPISSAVQVLLPGRSILEKSGLLLNRNHRLQYTDRMIESPVGTEPEWRVFSALGSLFGKKVSDAVQDREATLELLGGEKRLEGLKLSRIKAGGVNLPQI